MSARFDSTILISVNGNLSIDAPIWAPGRAAMLTQVNNLQLGFNEIGHFERLEHPSALFSISWTSCPPLHFVFAVACRM